MPSSACPQVGAELWIGTQGRPSACAYARTQVCDRNVENLSGGELQRFAIAVVAAQEANVYMLDEPSSYLDVRQRLKAAQVRAGQGRGFRGRGSRGNGHVCKGFKDEQEACPLT